MGKLLQKTLILAILILSTLCFSSCSLNAEAKLKKIAPDVDYDFVLTYNFGEELVINGTHYDIEDLAYNIFRKKATDRPIATNPIVIGKYLYSLYTYSQSKSLLPSGKNNRKWNVALLKTNVETAETTVIYDFIDVRPIGVKIEYPYSVCRFVDDKSFFFFYKGDLMLFDVNTETVTQTMHFYDENRAISENFTLESIKVGELYCDFYYYAGDGVVRYAEYRDGGIVDHTFNVDEDSVDYFTIADVKYYSFVERNGNYVYTEKYVNGHRKGFNCFDLSTDEDLGAEFADNLIKEEEEREAQEREESQGETDRREVVTVNGKDYYYYYGNNTIEIEDKEGNTLYSVSSSYAEKNNKKFIDLFCAYFDVKDGGVIANVCGAYSYENRLFISFNRSLMMWGRTASMTFEFNLETGDLSYLTYTRNEFSIYSITPKS